MFKTHNRPGKLILRLNVLIFQKSFILIFILIKLKSFIGKVLEKDLHFNLNTIFCFLI